MLGGCAIAFFAFCCARTFQTSNSNQRRRRFLVLATACVWRLAAQASFSRCRLSANACATETRVNGAIVPRSFGGHGMPCPYCRVGVGDACVTRLPPVLLLAPRPCLAAFSASRIAPQCLQTATLGFTFSPHAGQSANRVGT